MENRRIGVRGKRNRRVFYENDRVLITIIYDALKTTKNTTKTNDFDELYLKIIFLDILVSVEFLE